MRGRLRLSQSCGLLCRRGANERAKRASRGESRFQFQPVPPSTYPVRFAHTSPLTTRRKTKKTKVVDFHFTHQHLIFNLFHLTPVIYIRRALSSRPGVAFSRDVIPSQLKVQVLSLFRIST
jgi:hypothetical protein